LLLLLQQQLQIFQSFWERGDEITRGFSYPCLQSSIVIGRRMIAQQSVGCRDEITGETK